MKKNNNDFFSRLEKLCDERGISITRLAEDIGKSASTASGWKNGTKPQANTLRDIANYFHVSVAYLKEGNPFTNNGIVGNGNSNNTITINGTATRPLTELEENLLNVFGKLDTMKKAELLLSAKKLLGE